MSWLRGTRVFFGQNGALLTAQLPFHDLGGSEIAIWELNEGGFAILQLDNQVSKGKTLESSLLELYSHGLVEGVLGFEIWMLDSDEFAKLGIGLVILSPCGQEIAELGLEFMDLSPYGHGFAKLGVGGAVLGPNGLRFMKRELGFTISQLDSHGFAKRTLGSLISRLYHLEFIHRGHVLVT